MRQYGIAADLPGCEDSQALYDAPVGAGNSGRKATR